ncbi:hypothetical protein FIBSPDRAFT_815810 [Athelia psychrophila]|uniref:Transposase domain-containing protein n=1 Tax=Athelia psychrophila TaxID=1759441 RepID=A0A166SQQ7_9AGAM|nr:hypothetical protein FIBSPDRAFT_815810 [Fibularhizoctonia sp. CBS 109695]
MDDVPTHSHNVDSSLPNRESIRQHGVQSNDNERPDTDPPNFVPVIDDIITARQFIEALANASLDGGIEDADLLNRIRNPPEYQLTVDDPDLRLSLDIFLAIGNASEETYTSVCRALQRRYPESELLSYYKVKQYVAELSGVTAIEHDMCTNSCMAYTGPFSRDEYCKYCGELRYEEGPGRTRVPRKRFSTLPLAPQLQALWRTPAGADSMGYRERCTQENLAEIARTNGVRESPYRDFFDGRDYLDAVMEDRIVSGDMCLVLSIDGAQLYRNKVSECWIYIWVVLDHAPGVRYKKRHILPGGFIPGPNKPKNVDSFLFPGLYHLAAIQLEGLKIWNARLDCVFTSHPFLALVTADGPGMACISGFVGHQGKCHCRLHCPIIGRHKPGGAQYYPVRLKPDNYTVHGCEHADVDLGALLQNFTTAESEEQRYRQNLAHVESSPNPTEYKRRRLETGICKPTIFSGLPSKHILGIPGCFALDIMHLPALNIPDLMIPLWRGTFDCDKSDNRANWPWVVLIGQTWKDHGKTVSDATPYIPGSFDRPPRNPAEKINSGYKAWEFLLYFFGLGPCLFFGVLPEVYWKHYCLLVRGFQILMQEEISPAELIEAHTKITEFSDGFEELYCERRADRIHFVRPSIHTPSHIAPETERVGPGIIYGQWGMERTIGNLGEEIKQHSNAFANLAQRGLRRCQVNAIKAMIPDIEPIPPALPRGARDLGDGYALLRAVDTIQRAVRPCESTAIRQYYLETEGSAVEGDVFVTRWSRLKLPNGQVARSRWKESQKPLSKLRSARNIKFTINGNTQFAEVLFYMLLSMQGGELRPMAMVSLYGPHHKGLWEASSKTYWTAQHLGDGGVRLIDAKSIDAVVMLAPDPRYGTRYHDGSEVNRYYRMEKPGLKLSQQIGLGETILEED